MKTWSQLPTIPEPNQIYVFGSNTQGRHGKGSALVAKIQFGAIYGQASGIQNQSYAIITKDISTYPYKQISKHSIISQIEVLYEYARVNKDKEFLIAYRGAGLNLNGYSPREMADMFTRKDIPENIIFESIFSDLVKEIKITNDKMSLSEGLKKYFAENSSEKIKADWEKSAKYDSVGPTVDEFLENNKRINKELNG